MMPLRLKHPNIWTSSPLRPAGQLWWRCCCRCWSRCCFAPSWWRCRCRSHSHCHYPCRRRGRCRCRSRCRCWSRHRPCESRQGAGESACLAVAVAVEVDRHLGAPVRGVRARDAEYFNHMLQRNAAIVPAGNAFPAHVAFHLVLPEVLALSTQDVPGAALEDGWPQRFEANRAVWESSSAMYAAISIFSRERRARGHWKTSERATKTRERARMTKIARPRLL